MNEMHLLRVVLSNCKTNCNIHFACLLYAFCAHAVCIWKAFRNTSCKMPKTTYIMHAPVSHNARLKVAMPEPGKRRGRTAMHAATEPHVHINARKDAECILDALCMPIQNAYQSAEMPLSRIFLLNEVRPNATKCLQHANKTLFEGAKHAYKVRTKNACMHRHTKCIEHAVRS